MKKIKILSLLIAFMAILSGFGTVKAQPCTVPCNGPWTYVKDTFVETYTVLGCPYKFYLSYKYRPCMGAMQIEFDNAGCTCLGFIIEALDTSAQCRLHCNDVPAMYRIVYHHIINSLNSPILHASPSACYYIGTITVPPGAEACFGMTPGTTRYVTVPCQTNGCCYSKLEALPNNGIYQTVISSSPCMQTPTPPPSWNISWSCDILGGGYNTYTVLFTPDNPIICQTVCSSGPYYFGGGVAAKNATGIEPIAEETAVSNFSIYPNPVKDNCAVSFISEEAGQAISIDLTDITGKVINHLDIMSAKGKQTINLDTKGLVPGIYTVKLFDGKKVHIGKVIK